MDASKRVTFFVRASLAVNILILIAVCSVLIAFSTAEPVTFCWGQPTAGRGILLSVYFAILVVSILLLLLHVYTSSAEDRAAIEHMVVALLVTQILYKITTPATAGASNPVAISNLGVCVFHGVTLALLWHRRKASQGVRVSD